MAATATCLVLLAASGTWLTFRYRPGPSLGLPSGPADMGTVEWVMDVHRVLAIAFYALVAASVLALIGRRRPLALLPVPVLIVGTLIARASGSRMPWSVLALWAVRVNADYRGVWKAAFGPVVRFVIVAGTETSQVAYRRWVVAHLFAAPVLLAVALALALPLTASRRYPGRRSGSGSA